MASTTGLTIEEFESLPAALAKNHELVDGELVDVSGNTPRHILVRDCLTERTRIHVRENGLGQVFAELEYQFGQNAHGPDLSFLGVEKMNFLDVDRRVQPFVPDLAIEIVSTNDRFSAVETKVMRYVQSGVKEVYLFSLTARLVYRYTPNGNQILRETDDFRPEQLSGFSVRIAELFALN